MSVSWTEDRAALLARLWAQGLSAAQVAKALGGVTRSAVLAKIHRLGLANRAREPRRGGQRPARPPSAAPPRPRKRLPAARGAGLTSRADLEGLAPRLETLGRRDCHWPIGDPAAETFAFCGRPAVRGAYCAEHGRRAYRSPPSWPDGCDAATPGSGVAEVSAARKADLAARVAQWGPASLSEAEILRWLLARVEPTRPRLAEALLTRFGCVARVLGASLAQLTPVVGAAAAAELAVWRDVARRLLFFPILGRNLLASHDAVVAYLRLMLGARGREQFRVLFLDHANQLIADEAMGEGTVNHAPVYPREVVRRALELDACAVCLVHNHPSGDPTPSRADIAMTQAVSAAARALGLSVHDHFLVAGDQVVSFRAQGLM